MRKFDIIRNVFANIRKIGPGTEISECFEYFIQIFKYFDSLHQTSKSTPVKYQEISFKTSGKIPNEIFVDTLLDFKKRDQEMATGGVRKLMK